MRMRAFRLSKIWLMLSIVALLGVLSSPLFAFYCCCFSKSHPKNASNTNTAKQGVKSCHGAPTAQTRAQAMPSAMESSAMDVAGLVPSSSAIPPCHQQSPLVKDSYSTQTANTPTSSSNQEVSDHQASNHQVSLSALSANQCRCSSLTLPPVTTTSVQKAPALADSVAPALVAPTASLTPLRTYVAITLSDTDRAPRSPFLASLPGRSPPVS